MKAMLGHGANFRRVVVSLCDYTGNWPRPYHEAGHTVLLYDLKHGDDLLKITPENIGWDIWNTLRIPGSGANLKVVAVLAAPPCEHLTLAGTRFWKEKDADGRTDTAVAIVRSCLSVVAYFDPDVWALENPKGRIASLVPEVGLSWGFDPCDFAGYVDARLHDVTIKSPIEAILASNRYEKHTRIYGRATRPEERFVEPLVVIDSKGAAHQPHRSQARWQDRAHQDPAVHDPNGVLRCVQGGQPPTFAQPNFHLKEPMRTSDLSTVRSRTAVQAAYAALSAVQTFSPAEQVAGVAVLFNAVAKHLGISVSELLDKAERIERHDDTFQQREVKALRDYISKELR